MFSDFSDPLPFSRTSPVGQPLPVRTKFCEAFIAHPDRYYSEPDWAIVSAHRASNTEEQNRFARNTFAAYLRMHNYAFSSVVGHYNGVREHAFFIVCSAYGARHFGRVLGQESVLTHEGLVWTDGRNQDPVPFNHLAPAILGDAAREEQNFTTFIESGVHWSAALLF